MDDAWWGPTIPLPNGPWFCLAERNLPGSIIVNQAGRRFMNEALPYVEATHAIYEGEATGVGHVPSWMIIDQRYRNRYLFAGLGPRQPFPGRWYKSGVVVKAATLAELAAEIEVPAEALTTTVERFNGFAAAGVDEDFHRGESAYDKYYSDPTVKPNPSLHTIDQAPFYAVKIVPGDLGTKGGLVTDEKARVLRPDGSVIPGLYAAGNASSAVMGRTYAGPGRHHRPRAGVRLPGRRGPRGLDKLDHQGELMPIDPSVAIGAEVGSTTFSWTESDVLLYHLGIGAGSRPDDNVSPAALRYTLEGPALQVLPSFGVVVPTFHETDPPPLDLPGCDINLAQVVHGSQSITVTGPLPTSGAATVSTTLTDIWDKGKAAVIWQEGVARSESGEELWRTRSSIFVKGEGGWGGDRGSSEPVVVPDREPDHVSTYDVTPQQALLYRLCGDRNPLHADPEFAKTAGFPVPDPARPVLLRHRAARAHRRAARWRRQPGPRLHGRFAGVVFPGETIRVTGWRDGDRIIAAASIGGGERDGSPVLADCVLAPA